MKCTTWLATQGIAALGKSTYLHLPEMGLEGIATVTDLAHFRVTKSNTASDEEWASGLVTGVFKHIANGVYHLKYSNGDTLGVTGTHPLYSLDRQQFIPAEDIKVGEHLLSKSGIITVVAKDYDPIPQEVYNLEVGEWHNFLVGKSAVVVHNLCWKDFIKKSTQEQLDYVKDLWKQNFYTGNEAQFFGARRELEEITHGALYGPQGYKTTSDIATNFKAIDEYDQISEVGNVITAREVVSIKTTETSAANASSWWGSQPIKDNIKALKDGIDLNKGINWAGKTIKFPKAKLHLIVKEESEVAAWKVFLKQKTLDTGIKFEVTTLEKIITP